MQSKIVFCFMGTKQRKIENERNENDRISKARWKEKNGKAIEKKKSVQARRMYIISVLKRGKNTIHFCPKYSASPLFIIFLECKPKPKLQIQLDIQKWKKKAKSMIYDPNSKYYLHIYHYNY